MEHSAKDGPWDVGSHIQHSVTAWDPTQVAGQTASGLQSAIRGENSLRNRRMQASAWVANEG